MTTEVNKMLVSRYVEAYTTGNVAIADEIIAPDFVDHTQPESEPGPEGVKAMITTFRTAFPDAHVTVEHAISEGDMIAFRFVLRGTHRGTFAGIAPTGQHVTLTGIDLVRISEGKFAELWSNQDTLGLLQQLGVIPSGESLHTTHA